MKEWRKTLHDLSKVIELLLTIASFILGVVLQCVVKMYYRFKGIILQYPGH